MLNATSFAIQTDFVFLGGVASRARLLSFIKKQNQPPIATPLPTIPTIPASKEAKNKTYPKIVLSSMFVFVGFAEHVNILLVQTSKLNFLRRLLTGNFDEPVVGVIHMQH